MSSEQIKEYSLTSDQNEGFRKLSDGYDEMYPSPEGFLGRSISDITGFNAEVAFFYLKRLYESSYKKTERYPKSLAGSWKWGQIRHDSPFLGIPGGLLGVIP